MEINRSPLRAKIKKPKTVVELAVGVGGLTTNHDGQKQYHDDHNHDCHCHKP